MSLSPRRLAIDSNKLRGLEIPHWLTAIIPIIVVNCVLEQILHRDVITLCIVASTSITVPTGRY
jgi:hypothetical protein